MRVFFSEIYAVKWMGFWRVYVPKLRWQEVRTVNTDAQPRWGWDHLSNLPKVAQATLGFGAQSLWDCGGTNGMTEVARVGM